MSCAPHWPALHPGHDIFPQTTVSNRCPGLPRRPRTPAKPAVRLFPFPMTIAELFANEELRRHEFPVAQEKAFFAHAGVCPLPRRVAEAMRDYTLLGTAGDQEEAFPGSRIQQARR